MTFALKRVADWGTRFWFSVLAEDYLFRQGDEVSDPQLTVFDCSHQTSGLRLAHMYISMDETLAQRLALMIRETKLLLPVCWLWCQHKKLSYQEQVTASLIGGVGSALITLPVDVMVAQVRHINTQTRRAFPETRACMLMWGGPWAVCRSNKPVRRARRSPSSTLSRPSTSWGASTASQGSPRM